MQLNFMSVIYLMGLMALLPSCALLQPTPQKQILSLKPSTFSDLPGWSDDTLDASLTAFRKTCGHLSLKSGDKEFGLGTQLKDWVDACSHLPSTDISTPLLARTYFETWFTPYRVEDGQGGKGLFTGYYEPSLRGSIQKTGAFQTPLRARPQDLVMVNLGEFNPELKGQRIAGRVQEGYLKPYEDRQQIENGHLPAKVDVPLYWVDSPVDAFFLQVQGSGVITLPDGTSQRIGYDGQNGHPYTAIGKELLARGELTKDNVSMQSIRAWLAAHPSEAKELMQTNKSYVFFKKLETDGPVGAEGVVLTPERSLAVDRSVWPYGVPMYLDAEHPQTESRLQRLMISQDTGGAIKGIIRGDFFWGFGEQAEANAGLMKSEGHLWVLLPKKAN